MKIACLQFAPVVGDVDNNLNRADSVLNKASVEDLADLDLLVLPELAFSGMPPHPLGSTSAERPTASAVVHMELTPTPRLQFQVVAGDLAVSGASRIWHQLSLGSYHCA